MNRAFLLLGLAIVAFATALAVYVGNHLSNEALAVLTGVACGVGAMLPAAALGTLALLRRRDPGRSSNSTPSGQPVQAQPQYPPVIVVTPQAAPNALPPGMAGWQGGYPQQGYSLPSGGRKFSVIGDEEGEWE